MCVGHNNPNSPPQSGPVVGKWGRRPACGLFGLLPFCCGNVSNSPVAATTSDRSDPVYPPHIFQECSLCSRTLKGLRRSNTAALSPAAGSSPAFPTSEPKPTTLLGLARCEFQVLSSEKTDCSQETLGNVREPPACN